MGSNNGSYIIKTVLIIAVLAVLVFSPFIFSKFFKKDEVVEIKNLEPLKEIIGTSVEGRNIESYTYGDGEKNVLFVGGIHGGYEWNSTILAYEVMDYLENNPEITPENLSITIIPSLNPDGLFDVVGKEGGFSVSDTLEKEEERKEGLGRFNANNVDLNRNFDCKWQEESMWKGNTVSAGNEVFSEPEARALRDFVLENNPVAVIFWHSKANAVYASECEDGVLPETLDVMNLYSDAAGYKAVESFDAYEVTGDAEGWLASIGIPAITVELKTHEDIEFQKNLLGVKTLLGDLSNYGL